MTVPDDDSNDDDHISIYAYASLRLTYAKETLFIACNAFCRIIEYFFLLFLSVESICVRMQSW